MGYPGVINATNKCASCNEGLATTSGEVSVHFFSLFSPFDPTQGLVCGGKISQSLLKSHRDPEAWVHPGVISAMNNCAPCKEGLATISGFVRRAKISLLSLCELTQGLVCGGKVG